MCLVSPARVTALDGSTATLEVDGRRRMASILLEPDVLVGDWVIDAGGAVLRRIEASVATEMQIAVALASSPGPSNRTSMKPARGARDD
ncbi:MAG TPA: HypC/HybG/HupF family hydrogenase formation chaperone [Candidatus Limnocylindrales bacterium]